ncbi:hypothetical protein GW755_04240 [bacterium]|nr:hypothetical protein [bacterium]
MDKNTDVFDKIINLLDSNNIVYKLEIHKEVKTSEEAAKIRGVDISTGAKALVIKVDKQNFALFVMPANKQLSWKKLKEELGFKKPRMATIEEVENLTKCKVGGVPPFGNLMGLTTYFDKGIEDIKSVNFNAGLRTHSVNLKSNDLISLVKPFIANLC